MIRKHGATLSLNRKKRTLSTYITSLFYSIEFRVQV